MEAKMKLTRRQLRKLINEAVYGTGKRGYAKRPATIAYFYGYAGQLLIHVRTSTTSPFSSRIIGDIEIMLGGLVDEIAMLQAHAIAKVAEITGSKLDKPFLEARAIAEEARDNVSFKIRESFGDAYAHLLKLAYMGNDVLGTRRQLRRLINEAKHSADTQSILEAHATISYFYGYVAQLLAHAKTADYPHEFSRMIGHIDILLSGLLEKAGILRIRAGAKVTDITGTRLRTGREFRSLMQEAKDNASLKISQSFGDAYAHLLTLAYDGNNVLGTMALVDAAHIISPELLWFDDQQIIDRIEDRLDGIKIHLQFDEYLNAMDSLK